jgi:hypothetical protein
MAWRSRGICRRVGSALVAAAWVLLAHGLAARGVHAADRLRDGGTYGGRGAGTASARHENEDALRYDQMDPDGGSRYAAMNVEHGATLGGHGQINASEVTVRQGGTLAPGGSAGQLEIEGNLTLAGGATLRMKLGGGTPGDGEGCYDQIVVRGAVTLGTGEARPTLAVTVVPPYLLRNVEYVLVANDGADPVAGRFSNGTTLTIDGVRCTIRYDGGDGNDIALRVGMPGSILKVE